MSTQWTLAEIAEAQHTFTRIKERGFPVPKEIIFPLTECYFTVSIECAVVRINDASGDSKWQALWIQRPADDPYYPGMWHMPGKMQLPHEPMRKTVERCLAREVGLNITGNNVPKIGFYENPDGLRGHEHQHQFCAFMPPEAVVKTEHGEPHQWVDVCECAPEPFIPTHAKLLGGLRLFLQKVKVIGFSATAP